MQDITSFPENYETGISVPFLFAECWPDLSTPNFSFQIYNEDGKVIATGGATSLVGADEMIARKAESLGRFITDVAIWGKGLRWQAEPSGPRYIVQCGECRGTGKIALLTSVVDCACRVAR